MASPELGFRDFIEEASNMRRLAVAGGFVDSASDERLSLFQEQIEKAKVESHPDRPWPLEISKDTPVRTRLSRGEYQPNKDEDRAVFGQLATRWHIRPTGSRRKSGGYRSFVVDSAKGATTSVSV